MGTQYQDASATITNGGSAQVAQASRSRVFMLLQNPSTETEVLEVNLVGAAGATGTVTLSPGDMIVASGDAAPGNAISVKAATTGHKYTLWYA